MPAFLFDMSGGTRGLVLSKRPRGLEAPRVRRSPLAAVLAHGFPRGSQGRSRPPYFSPLASALDALARLHSIGQSRQDVVTHLTHPVPLPARGLAGHPR